MASNLELSVVENNEYIDKDIDNKSVTITERVQIEKWSNSFEFLLSCIGFSVGAKMHSSQQRTVKICVDNVWRFPFKCFNNGGGAFLIPYFLFLFLAAIPIYFLESSIGIGIGMIICNILTTVYYQFMVTYVIYYLFVSFQATLPWENCDNPWNTIYCSSTQQECIRTGGLMDGFRCTYEYENYTHSEIEGLNLDKVQFRYSSEEFWRFEVLQEQDANWENPGPIVWHIVLSAVLSWCLIYICIAKGVKAVGKVVYFTVSLPIILLAVFFVKGITLDGFSDGIFYFINPRWEMLLVPGVWIDAAVQVLFSNGVAFGIIIALSSHNKFDFNVKTVAIIASLCNSVTSIFAGFTIFAILGFMAKQLQVDIENVVSEGTGLAFVAYPEATTLLPLPQLWSILFFLMLLTLGLDSQFAAVEAITTGMIDMFPRLGRHKALLLCMSLILMFTAGLIMCTKGGIYIFTIFDWYAVSIPLLVFATSECLVISWIYGAQNFSNDIESMIGSGVSYLWKALWGVISPAVILALIVSYLATMPPIVYSGYVFPASANVFGWCLSLSSALMVPIWFFYSLVKEKGTMRERWRKMTTPTTDWGPADDENRQKWLVVCGKRVTEQHGIDNEISKL